MALDPKWYDYLICFFRGHDWTHIAPINPYMRQWCRRCGKNGPKPVVLDSLGRRLLFIDEQNRQRKRAEKIASKMAARKQL